MRQPTDPTPFLQQTHFCKRTVQLPKEAKKKAVIALGEPNHGSSSTATLRLQLILSALQEGPVTVALEAPEATVIPLDDYLQGRLSWSDDLVKGIGSWPWRTIETRTLIQQLKYAKDKRDADVRIIGLDPQVPVQAASFLLKHAVFDPESKKRQLRAVKRLATLRAGSRLPADSLDDINDLMDSATQTAQDSSDIKRAVEDAISLARSPHASLLHQLNSRDQLMAQKVLKELDSTSTLIVAAHNGHISNTSYAAGNVRAMGSHLKAALGADYWSIPTFIGEGSFRAYKRLVVGRSTSPKTFTLGTPAHTTLEYYCSRVSDSQDADSFSYFAPRTEANTSPALRHQLVRSHGAIVPATWSFQYDKINLVDDCDGFFYIPKTDPSTEMRILTS